MKFEQYATSIDRLKNVYGDKSYPEERVKLIWSEVKMMDFPDFSKLVDELILTERFAPLAKEFRELKARVYDWRYRKEKETRAAENHRPINQEESQIIFRKIIARMNRLVPNQEWEDWKATIKNSYGFQKESCTKCDDLGFIFKNVENCGEAVFKCTCKKGMARPERYPFA